MSWNAIRGARQRLSREMGTIIKDWGGRLPVAIVYPNTYYIGMSNLGIQAIYSLLNSQSRVVCERVFWEHSDSALSIESQHPLADFAVLAFSVSYELDYFNIAPILKDSGIPIYAADREENQPLVIAGGPCISANPMPLVPFFDCLCIGEAEPILPAMLPVIKEGIRGKRDELLKALAKLPGVYVPKFPPSAPVVRQWTANLDDFPVHSVVLTPDTEFGELYLIEIERGCKWGCRFCLVSTCFRPVRFRSLESLVAQAKTGLQYRNRLGLVGPSVADHPQFDVILSRLKEMSADISVSSLRIKPLPGLVLGELAKGRTRTVVFAPEAGSERLRQVIRKGITEDDIIAAVGRAADEGIKQLKLYFMLGLPTETDEDIDEIVRLAFKCKSILERRVKGSRIILSLSPFVPKAGTPFQWLPMEQLSVLNNRLRALKRDLIPAGIQVKEESTAWSEVQAVLARGDARLAGVLAGMEKLSLSTWRQALAGCHLDAGEYAHRMWDAGERLPWAILDPGISLTSLKRELDLAVG
ncbi:MAG: radical SAM protein [Chloroflexi bacterium]|nr:radical SAM protein [Chloroflexota bacterium]